MNDKVVSIIERIALKRRDEGATEHDRFLIDEGLDLLAAYRQIPDRTTRLAILRLTEAAVWRSTARPAKPPRWTLARRRAKLVAAYIALVVGTRLSSRSSIRRQRTW